jgi:ribose transport system substrate-binding protein
MNYLKLACSALTVALALTLAACGNDTPPTTQAGGGGAGGAPSGKKWKIAVIPKGTSSEYWKILHAGAEKGKQELAKENVNVDIIWKGPLKEDQSAEQISVVEDMFNNNVDAIVLAPNNATALSPVVDTAAKKNIPVVIIDSGIATQNYKSYVATDNKKGGHMGGVELAKQLGGKGKVLMLRYMEGSASTEEREQGFLDAMKEAGITVVDASKYGGPTSDSGQKAAENLLAAYTKDGVISVDGIFCPNQTTTFGMLRALEDAKIAGKVKFVGFDADAVLAQAVKDKKISALVVQNPIAMGEKGVRIAVDLINGKTVERFVDSGCSLVTTENVNTPEAKELLTPDISKYLKE